MSADLVGPPACTCGGVGFYRLDVPAGHADFGRRYDCACTRQAQEEEARRTRLAQSGVADLDPDWTFTGFRRETSPAGVQRAAAVTARYADAPEGWLVLWGQNGWGKTHLLVAALRRRLERGDEARYLFVPDFLDTLREAYRGDAHYRLLRAAEEHPFLGLDDLGAEVATDWARGKLFQILDHRWARRTPTLLTMNVSPDQAAHPGLASRLTAAWVQRRWLGAGNGGTGA